MMSISFNNTAKLFTFILSFCALICASTVSGFAEVSINGVVEVEEGIPNQHVIISISPVFQHGETRFAEAEESGEFSLNCEAEGIFKVVVTAPFAQEAERFVYLEKGESASVEVYLARIEPPAYNNRVMVFGNFNDYRAPGLLLKRKEKQRFQGVVTSDSTLLEYTYLVGSTRKKDAVPDPAATDYVYRDDIWYSRRTVTPGDVEITWVFQERNSEDKSAAVSQIVCLDESVEERSLWLHTARDYESRLTQAYRDYSVENGSAAGFSMDWKADVQQLDSALQSNPSEPLRRVLLAAYAALAANQAAVELDTLRVALDVVPPHSTLWGIHQFSSNFALSSVTDTTARNEYLHQFIDQTKSDKVGAALMFAELVVNSGINPAGEITKQWYDRLLSEYPSSQYSSIAKKNYNPGRSIIRGKHVPAFEVVTYPDSTRTITDSTMLGKVYLIDFWATWCGPCVGEMPVLHQAWEKYGKQGLEMISISFDRKQEDMERFISGKWSMPWTHTFVSYKDRAKLSQDFEVSGIPKPVLVDEHGIIIASGSELRGEGLLRVLESVFEQN